MRGRISWLTAATTSAMVLGFVLPLFLLVRTLAEDRGLASADQEARNVAILVSGLHGDPELPELVTAVDERSDAVRTSVLTPDGQVLGTPDATMPDDPGARRAANGRAFTVRDDAGARVYVPVITEDGTSVVRTSVSDAALHQGVARAWLSIGALGLLMLGAAVLAAYRLARRISTPVTDLAQVAHELREGRLDARVDPSGPPETVELGIALNRLAERTTELLAAEREAVGDLSHRLRTPVTALRLDADAVRDPELAERLQGHVAQLQRTVDAIVKDAKRPVLASLGSQCDATGVVRERIDFWSALAEDQARTLRVGLPDTACLVALDADDLRDIVDILVDNVFAHTPEGTAFAVDLTVGVRIVLAVQDEGPGYDARGTETERVGTSGLGLQIVRRTVGGRGGDVHVQAEPGRGVRVEVTLPAAMPA